ncbi:phosphatidylglycerol lysyltransferase domain-containing protein [Amorphoplanes nipponensis]|uniref:Membrane protein n=1 Tax=Actinoplanes nipponensis TaxID=135950 RepID=A0A919JDA3_9ACTN|nr:membrane protein [Actinoplanes nipponensis]
MDAALSVLPTWHQRFPLLAELVPTAGILTARAATGVVGVLLIYLGAGLRRGKHRAWQLAVGLSALSAVLHLVKGLAGAAAFGLALCALLVWKRDHFTALGDLRNRWRALRAGAMFLGAGFLLGFAEIAVRANRLVDHPGVVKWAEHAALGLVGVSGPVQFQHPMGAAAVSVTTGAFGLLAFTAAAVLLLRPGTRRRQPTPEDEARLRATLHRHGGGDSLGYFALRADKLLIWGPSGRAAVAYRVVNGVSLASGDPLGPPSAWPEAIAAWLDDCARHGWTPAVLACGTPGGTAYRRAGLDVIELGDEAIVEVPGFSLEGRCMRGVRQAVGRMRRAGYTCEVIRRGDLSADVLAEAVHCANALRVGKVERGFSMALSRLGQAADADCLYVLCRDAEGRLRGLLHFVPWGDDGLSLDLMRGDRDAGNGLTELMIVSAIEAAAGLGVRRISLNFAVLRSVFARAEQLGAGPVIRLWARLLGLVSRFWQIESLYRANAKYQPLWQPRFLCFPSARDLPRIALAALGAESFLPQRATSR